MFHISPKVIKEEEVDIDDHFDFVEYTMKMKKVKESKINDY